MGYTSYTITPNSITLDITHTSLKLQFDIQKNLHPIASWLVGVPRHSALHAWRNDKNSIVRFGEC